MKYIEKEISKQDIRLLVDLLFIAGYCAKISGHIEKHESAQRLIDAFHGAVRVTIGKEVD